MTRRFLLQYRETEPQVRQEICDEIANAWKGLDIQRVRLFLAGPSRMYVNISARDWTGHGVVRDGAGILRRPGMTCQELSRVPSPQKRYTGTWRVFTLADTLRHFAEHFS